MPWQRLVSDVAGEWNEATGRFCYEIVDLVVPRQAGKTLIAVATLIQRAGLRRMARGWYTAQTRQDAADKFVEDWVPMIESSAIKPLVTIRKANGSERMTVKRTKSSIGLFAPTRKGLHSKQADTVVVDECWAFDSVQGADVETGARPAQITRPHRQLWRISAAGDERSTYLDEIMQSGRELVESGRQSKRAYFEWSAPVDADDDFDPYDRELWWAAHPALGHTIDEDAIATDAETMSPGDFARNYLCIPAKGSVTRVISGESWRKAAVSELDRPSPQAFAVDVSPARTEAAIGVCGRRDDGRAQVEVVDHRPGTAWLLPRLLELHERYRARLILDPIGPAGALRNDLTRAGVPFTEMTGRTVGQACGAFYDGIIEGRVVHIDQPELNSALGAARKRPMGDGAWAWDRKHAAVDISPLVVVTLAHWAADLPAEKVPLYIY